MEPISDNRWEAVGEPFSFPSEEDRFEPIGKPTSEPVSQYEQIPDQDLNLLQRAEKAAVKYGFVKPGAEIFSPAALEQKKLALKTAANTLAVGYLPQITAGIKTGSLTSPEYIKERDIQAAQLAQAESGTQAIGQALGAIPALAAGPLVAPAKTLGKRIAQSAAISGAIGALANPQDIPGELSGMQLPERASQAWKSALLGGGLTAIAGIPEMAPSLQKSASMRALKQSGAMLKDYRGFQKRNLIDEASQMLLDPVEMPKGQKPIRVVTPGATLSDVAERTDKLIEAHGKIIGDVQNVLDNNFDKLATSPVGQSLFNPLKTATRIQQEVVAPWAGTKMSQATGDVQDVINNLASLGDKPIPFETAKKQLKAIDEFLNYSKEMSPQKELLKRARGIINNELEKAVDAVGQATNFPLYDNWKRSKEIYGYMKSVNDMAKDKIFREGANRFISPSDYATGIGAMIASAAAQGDVGFSALATGAMTGALNQAMRKYGNAMAANVANIAQKGLTQPAIQQTFGALGRKAVPMAIATTQAGAATPENQNLKALEKVSGSQYEVPLRQAMQRGPDSFASTYYILHQSDPKFRALVKEDENQ